MVVHGQGMLWLFSAKIRDITLTILFFTVIVYVHYFAYRTNFGFACKFKHTTTRGEVPHCSANSLLPIVVQRWILIVQVTVS